ncbi:MAG: hypothetical protein WD267_10150 [Balneolales bacterium]
MAFSRKLLIELRLLTTILFLFICDVAGAQIYGNIYRPSSPEWQQLKTPRFTLIYQQGEDSAAYSTGRILESQYNEIKDLVGGELKNMPVVLNGYNDRSNGYVTPLYFRIEIEIPSIKGKTLNPATGGWFENVAPHELVHALHLSVNPAWGFSSLVNIFSPDFARATHSIAPSGMLEGIAVYHESNIRPGEGGRGNYPYFTNMFNSNFAKSNRWGMGEMHFPPGRSRPFNRPYIGGHEFTDWLLDEYGMETTRDNIRLIARWPFFGYGYTLRRTTGKWPSQLYNEFSKDISIVEEQRLSFVNDNRMAAFKLIDTFYEGPNLSRPVWLSNHEVLFYGSYYNRRPGFHKHNLNTDEQSLIYETEIVEDNLFDLSPDKQTILYSRYHSHPYYHNTWLMDVHELNINDGRSTRLTTDARLHAPVYTGDSLWALQTHHETSKWVSIDDEGETSAILSLHPDNLVEVRPNPLADEIALVTNRNGVQALWVISREDSTLGAHPTVYLPGASIFDVTWNSQGNNLLFSADFGPAMNLFEYHIEEQSLIQVTNSKYNAFEGSYSPDESQIAFISQEGDYRRLAVMNRSDFLNLSVPDDVWKEQSLQLTDDVEVKDDTVLNTDDWEKQNYSTGLSWLRPRGFLPLYENSTQVGHRYGLGITSGDVLRKNSYMGSISTSNNHLWYNATYRYSGFFPGFQLNAYNKPVQVTNGILEERGAGIQIPINITTKSNTRFSGFSVTPGIRTADLRIMNKNGDALSDWQNTLIGTLHSSYNHRLQQNIRDAQPNTGVMIFAQNEIRQNLDDHWSHSMRGGLSVYTSPLRQYNQSLRLGVELLSQDGPGISSAGFAWDGFTGNVLADLNHAYSLSTRYTIPLWNPDRAWLLVPIQVERFYTVVFSNTVGPIQNDSLKGSLHQSRSIYGIGLRMGFGLFNARIDIGVAIGIEPMRDSYQAYFGYF